MIHKISLLLLLVSCSCLMMRISEASGIDFSSEIVYWIGANPHGYWQDPSNWENHQIPTMNQTAIIKHSKLRILPDLDVIKVKRIIVESNIATNQSFKQDENLILIENPILISNGIEIGEFSKVIFNENVACLEDFNCQLNVRGKVEVFDGGRVGYWNEKWNGFRMETCLKNSQASFKISNKKIMWNETKSIEEWKDSLDGEFGELFANHEILLFVPSTRNVNEQISNEELETLLERIISDISHIVGGVTLHPNQKGYWLSEREGLVSELVNIISVSVPDNLLVETKRKVKEISLQLLEELNQEAIFVKIDSNSFLLTKNK